MSQLTVHFLDQKHTRQFMMATVVEPMNAARTDRSIGAEYAPGFFLKPDVPADTLLRNILVDARKEGLQFRFWFACGPESRDRMFMLISTKDVGALEKFDDFLSRYERKHNYTLARSNSEPAPANP